MAFMSHGVQGVGDAYKTAFSASRDGMAAGRLKSARAVLSGLGKNFFLLGFGGSLMGFISMLTNYSSDPNRMASGLATLLLTVFYAIIANALFSLPFVHRLDGMIAGE